MIVVMAVMMALALIAGQGMMGHGGHDQPKKQETVEKQAGAENPSPTKDDHPAQETHEH